MRAGVGARCVWEWELSVCGSEVGVGARCMREWELGACGSGS